MDHENQEESRPRGNISDLGVLDLRYAKTPEDLADIHRISDVGVILVTESAGKALNSINISDVGTVVTVPDGNVVLLTGQSQFTGESLAHGDPEFTLMVVGQLFVTTPIEKIGYKELRILGQMCAPRGSEAAVTSKLKEVSGQILYVGPNPKLILGNDEFGDEFFGYLPAPITLVVLGNLHLKSDVTIETIKEKVLEFAVFGNVSAPAHLIPLISALATTKFGNISAS